MIIEIKYIEIYNINDINILEKDGIKKIFVELEVMLLNLNFLLFIKELKDKMCLEMIFISINKTINSIIHCLNI